MPKKLQPTSAHATLVKNANKSPLASKKLWVTILGIAAIVVPAIVTGGVTLPVVSAIAPTLVAYLLGQSYVDAATAKALADAAVHLETE